jgi:hypothetical protein
MTMRVRVVFAVPEHQTEVVLDVLEGTSVQDAVRQATGLERFEGSTPDPLVCAVFGKAVELSQPVSEGDRIEVLRPLQIDPKQSRREAAGKVQRKY